MMSEKILSLAKNILFLIHLMLKKVPVNIVSNCFGPSPEFLPSFSVLRIFLVSENLQAYVQLGHQPVFIKQIEGIRFRYTVDKVFSPL